MTLIATSDGHGMETPGKRSPLFPDGTQMKENEFNRAVVDYLNEYLKQRGFEVLHVSAGDSDVPLKTRTDLANSKKADFYISVHANALGSIWQNARGIETYCHPNSNQSLAAARVIHSHIMKGTKLPDRKVKTADFHELRETKMPAVLVECGFMDNEEDIKLLMSDEYRKECALELTEAICAIFNVPFQVKNIVATGIFKDVSDTHWAKNEIERAYHLGIMKGIGEDKFGIGKTLTREEMATIIMRLYDRLNGKTE